MSMQIVREYARKAGKGGKPKNTPEVIWSKIDRRGPNECWLWKGHRTSLGYGRVNINRTGYFVHRLIFDQFNPGVITFPAEAARDATRKIVMHTCDNPTCCNPSHMKLGTQKDNIKDMIKKGRRADFRGERSHRAKLTNVEAAEIRRLASMRMLQKEIAKMFNISVQTVCDIKKRRTFQGVA